MADDKKLCKTFLRAAAKKVRTAGLARGARMDAKGQVCMLGAMDYCGVTIDYNERMRIEKHVAKMLTLINARLVQRQGERPELGGQRGRHGPRALRRLLGIHA